VRILSVMEKWPKLKNPRWPTFRLQRRDKDWQVGEFVQVVYRTRSKQREVLGIARIVKKEIKHFGGPFLIGTAITEEEAIEDGFSGAVEMANWMLKTHGDRVRREILNKLTIAWIRRVNHD
jgi:hypothetical protein